MLGKEVCNMLVCECGRPLEDFAEQVAHHSATGHWLEGGPHVGYVHLGDGVIGIELDGIPFEKLDGKVILPRRKFDNVK